MHSILSHTNGNVLSVLGSPGPLNILALRFHHWKTFFFPEKSLFLCWMWLYTLCLLEAKGDLLQTSVYMKRWLFLQGKTQINVFPHILVTRNAFSNEWQFYQINTKFLSQLSSILVSLGKMRDTQTVGPLTPKSIQWF